MSIQKIIQESINGNPLEMKEAFAEELRNRVAEALAARMEEVDLEEAEQINEISKDTVRSYADKSFRQANTLLKHSLSDQPKSVERASKAAFKRRQFGIKAAGRRLGSDEMQNIHKNAMEEVDLGEAVEVRHDRYMRSHGKKASGSGGWFFTHKSGPVNNLDDNKEVHFHQGKFSDAAKSAKEWAKKNGHSAVYVMEEIEQIDEVSKKTLGSYIKKAVERLPKHQRDASAAAQVNSIDDYKKSAKMRDNRKLGIQRAADRLTKE